MEYYVFGPSPREERAPISFDSVEIVKSVGLFLGAALCEVGGGWLIWKVVKEKWPWWCGVLGAVLLVGYGFVPTLQESFFGRVYAAYGGFFILFSLLWGWALDSTKPDRWDVIGAAIAVLGVAMMMFWPRPFKPEQPHMEPSVP